MAKVSLRAYNREIESMLDRGNYIEVVAHCHHILKTHPKHLETYRLLGKAYLEQKKRGDAVNIFSRVLVAVPNDFVAHVGMSIVRDEENKLDDAIWHMERAFETQPSNAAIQSELQRLYSRRDGVAPPRIRMTRGALAHMYVKGELYPQAISEIKSVLKEDPGRSDMQALLARVHYKSGQKNEAADAANSILRRYPYCYDANATLAEILGNDHPDSAQLYRQRVIELDPYAAHVSGSLLQPADAPDSAVALERLEYSGQAVEWRESSGISLASGRDHAAQPAWLTGGFSAAPPQPTPAPASVFDTSPSPQTDSASSNDNIPDFLRQAGWGQSTGAFDESKPAFANDETLPSTQAAPLAEGDMPDWVKAMAPAEALKPADEEAVLPDWINRIGTGELKTDSPAANQPDWMKPSDAPAPPTPFAESSNDQPDWLQQLSQPEPPAGSPAPTSNDFDFLDQLKDTAEPSAPGFNEPPRASPATMDLGSLGSSDQELDASFAWLESLAAKQGASEGLLMKPEDRLEQEPDWVKQAKSLHAESPLVQSTPQEPPAQPSGNLEALGKSEQERDDSFSWLESLAAKQGASEGLLTKPEDRLEQAPDWVNQAKEIGESQPAAQEPSAMDTGMWLRGLEDSDAKPEAVVESSGDDTAMWLKSLDEPEAAPAAESPGADDLPSWMQSVEEEKKDSETEPAIPASEADASPAGRGSFDQPVAGGPPKMDTGSLPSWLRGLDKAESNDAAAQGDLPAWLRDDTGEAVAEPVKIEPTRADEWQPTETTPELFETPEEKPRAEPKPRKAASKKTEPRPAAPVTPHQEPVTRKGTDMLTQTVELVLGQARNELNRSNIPGALETYAKLIKRGRFLDEVIFDLREALYRYPVEVSIWQSLGDAYNRSNRLQDALDAYTKAEELLR